MAGSSYASEISLKLADSHSMITSLQPSDMLVLCWFQLVNRVRIPPGIEESSSGEAREAQRLQINRTGDICILSVQGHRQKRLLLESLRSCRLRCLSGQHDVRCSSGKAARVVNRLGGTKPRESVLMTVDGLQELRVAHRNRCHHDGVLRYLHGPAQTQSSPLCFPSVLCQSTRIGNKRIHP